MSDYFNVYRQSVLGIKTKFLTLEEHVRMEAYCSDFFSMLTLKVYRKF